MGDPQDYCTGGECPDIESFFQEDDAATVLRRQRADRIRGRVLVAVTLLCLAGAAYLVVCFNVRSSVRYRVQIYPETIVLLDTMIGPIADDIRDLSMNPNVSFEELNAVRAKALVCSQTLIALVVLNNTLLLRSAVVSANDGAGIFECVVLSRVVSENLRIVAESLNEIRSDLCRMKIDAEKGKKYSI